MFAPQTAMSNSNKNSILDVHQQATTGSSVLSSDVKLNNNCLISNQFTASFSTLIPEQLQQPLINKVTSKKRSQPGYPDPDAEVIALSPKTLMATNRFICEVCKKGFQRDQNLQLHRRGHNLPWKLRKRCSSNEDEELPSAVVKKKRKVYVCPETTCVHHHPSRALGDLTGIKKHFCRKHGEKKWNCNKCSKKYAVMSDWKAHVKTCGTRAYKCDCGTLFSRKDSYVTHRAFCNALAEESARMIAAAATTPAVLQHHPTHHQSPLLLPFSMCSTINHASNLIPSTSVNPNPNLNQGHQLFYMKSEEHLPPSTSNSNLFTAVNFPCNMTTSTALLQKACPLGSSLTSNVDKGDTSTLLKSDPATRDFLGVALEEQPPELSLLELELDNTEIPTGCTSNRPFADVTWDAY